MTSDIKEAVGRLDEFVLLRQNTGMSEQPTKDIIFILKRLEEVEILNLACANNITQLLEDKETLLNSHEAQEKVIADLVEALEVCLENEKDSSQGMYAETIKMVEALIKKAKAVQG